MKVLHVSSVDPIPNSGMGRVSFQWKLAFESLGHSFLHVGLNEIPHSINPLFQGWYFRKYIKKNNIKADIILAHEPLAGFLKFKNVPLVSFSHGVEESAWSNKKKYFNKEFTFKSKLIPSFVRFLSNNLGFKKADLVFVLNNDDSAYLEKKGVTSSKVVVIKNGYFEYSFVEKKINNTNSIVFLFNASWLKRKGIDLLIYAFSRILLQKKETKLIIAGTNTTEQFILSQFNLTCHHQIKVIPHFTSEEEKGIYADADIFILPSYIEGQSLALLQAMAMGLCPIAANNSGQKDVIQHMQNGLLFETGNKDKFYDTILWCIENYNMVNQFGANAKHSLLGNNWSNVSNDVCLLCEKLVIS
jgi:glycosyltransferase involved in cell wall biosynthesis